MDKAKPSLLAAFGFLALLGALFLATQRLGHTQIEVNPPNIKKPFQIQLDLTTGAKSFPVPANQTLVVEYVSVNGVENHNGSSIQVQTTVGGNAAAYALPADAFTSGNIILNPPYSRPNMSSFTRFYASGGSTVTVSGQALSVTLSGYLTRLVF